MRMCVSPCGVFLCVFVSLRGVVCVCVSVLCLDQPIRHTPLLLKAEDLNIPFWRLNFSSVKWEHTGCPTRLREGWQCQPCFHRSWPPGCVLYSLGTAPLWSSLVVSGFDHPSLSCSHF